MPVNCNCSSVNEAGLIDANDRPFSSRLEKTQLSSKYVSESLLVRSRSSNEFIDARPEAHRIGAFPRLIFEHSSCSILHR